MGKSKGLVSDAFISDLLEKVNIVSLIDSRLGNQLKKKGANYQCCCPFHEEDTPSFVVNENKQIYTCFGGCDDGKAGNAINFIRNYQNLNFVEAVKVLCDEVGMEHPFGREENLDPKAQLRRDVIAALEDASTMYQGFLKDQRYSESAVGYLKGRGIDGKTAKDFGLGVAPKEWAIVMKHLSRKHGQEVLKEAGLLTEKNGRKFDMFRDRIMFPIADARGRTIGFGGRRLDDSSDAPKYINSPETIVFLKNKELYNFDKAQNAARKTGKLYITEGYTDVIAHSQFGIKDTVAPLGTAFTEGQLEKVLSVTSEPVMCFDGDKAGRAAAWKAMQMSLPHLNDGVRMKFLFFPQGYDPDTLLRSEGVDAYQARLETAMPLSQFVIAELENRYGNDSPESAAAIASEVAGVIAGMPHGVYREVMLKSTAEAIGLPEQRLIDAMVQQHPQAQVRPAHPQKGRPNPGASPKSPDSTPAQRSPQPGAPAARPTKGSHFTGGAMIPSMTQPKVGPAPRFEQFQNRFANEIKELRESGNIEAFTRKAVTSELRSNRGAVNARYLADNLTKTIESFVGADSAKTMAPKIRNYTLNATQEYNKRLVELEKGDSSPKPNASPSHGMGMSR
jgi:DNA primase